VLLSGQNMAMGFAAVVAAAVLLLAGTAAGQTVTVNATKFYNNDKVTVTLSGVTAPTVNDSIGLFLASAANPDDLRPIKCADPHLVPRLRCSSRDPPCPTWGSRCRKMPAMPDACCHAFAVSNVSGCG